MAAIYWLRNDLRIFDNKTMYLFCQNAKSGIIVYTLDPKFTHWGIHRQNFLMQSLQDLNNKLKNQNQEIIVTYKSIFEFIIHIQKQVSITDIFCTKEYAFNECQQELALAKICNADQIKLNIIEQNTIFKMSDLPFAIEKMPNIYTQFRKKIESIQQTYTVNSADMNLPEKVNFQYENGIQFNDIENRPTHPVFQFIGGESAAIRRLSDYFWQTQSIMSYKETRNQMLELNDSSKFSPWINLGCLSVQFILSELKKIESEIGHNESTQWFFYELLWREYFKFLSLKYGSKIFTLSGIQNKPKKYFQNKAVFNQWCLGQTENAFINAHMIELNSTGWMSNRGRQNVASYLIHHLHLPWTWGAQYFEKQLIDYDPDQNWGNWLYLSGQGTDPRDRAFDPVRQQQMYDPNNEYQNTWFNLHNSL